MLPQGTSIHPYMGQNRLSSKPLSLRKKEKYNFFKIYDLAFLKQGLFRIKTGRGLETSSCFVVLLNFNPGSRILREFRHPPCKLL